MQTAFAEGGRVAVKEAAGSATAAAILRSGGAFDVTFDASMASGAPLTNWATKAAIAAILANSPPISDTEGTIVCTGTTKIADGVSARSPRGVLPGSWGPDAS